MERRVGQHHAELAAARRHRRRERRRRVGARGHEHDRRFGRGEQARFIRPEHGVLLHALEVGAHDRERLLVAVFALAQPPHGRIVRGVHEQLEAAEALDRHDLAGADGVGRSHHGSIAMRHDNAGRVPQGHLRTTHRAGVRLGVEAAVERVVVLALTGVAHHEVAHRRVRAVVRQLVDDAVARPAVGAVDERVAVAAVVRVEQFAAARLAEGDVGHHDGARMVRDLALVDGEFGQPGRVEPRAFDALNGGPRRTFPLEGDAEVVELRPLAFHLDDDAVRGVVHPAAQLPFVGEAVDEGAEAHPLHRAAHDQPQPLSHAASRPGRPATRPIRRCLRRCGTRSRRSAGPDWRAARAGGSSRRPHPRTAPDPPC